MSDDFELGADLIPLAQARRERPLQLRVIDPVHWHGKTPPPREWLVPDLIPMRNVTLLSGHGGVGKSTLALQLLAAAALGLPWLGMETPRINAVGFFAEDDVDELQRRLAAVLKHLGREFGDLEGLRILDRVDCPNALMQWPSKWKQGAPTMLFRQVEQLTLDSGAQLLVVDSLYNVFAGDKLEERHAWEFISMLRGLALKMNGAVLLTFHPSQSGMANGTDEFGSVGWHNACRSRFYLTKSKNGNGGDDADTGARELKRKKSNYSGAAETIRLQWRDGVFVREDQRTRPSGLVETLQLDHDVMTALRGLVADGALIPADANASRSLPNAGRKTPALRRYAWGVIRASQERLLAQGKIERVEMGPQSKRRVYVRPADMLLPGEVKGSK